ncbi:MAG TPA: hypothetical protein VF510_17910 [Ktedonobacterales bacterium]
MSEATVAPTASAGSIRSRWTGVVKRIGVPPALIRYALLLFIVSRIGFIALTFGAIQFLHPIGGGANSFLDAWVRYDATLYARLARDGYQSSPFYRAAFFPLQPLATAIVAPLTGGNWYIAGIVVSNVAYFFALLGLGMLALHEDSSADDDQRVADARRAMLYLTVYPMALFLFAGYAESLFLALATWCLVAIRRGAWWQAGALGLLAAMTRQMGLFLAVPFAYDYARQAGWRLRSVRINAAWVLLIPGGLLLFMGWLWYTRGDPLAFQHAENYWDHVFSPPWATFPWAWRLLLHERNTLFLYKDVVDLVAVLLFAGLIVVGARRLRLGDTAYSAAVWLLALSYPAMGWPLQSDARYMLAAFPCFLTLARLGRRRWLHALIAIVFGVVLVLVTQYFVRGALFL